ncbi:MAG TPA: hypothetical protein PK125_00775 [Syntrophorhabdus sp.]|jgi:hypothetical protein|nr:MAG: hypothetical protein A4E59_02477 [Syntrophorhabdus sp. PtaB.Bin027]OQB77921.1 MAG: hypothetical protein BWX92_00563 [Deltaproteobacteria bacterium ADurb.Bin135]HPB36672.1 hypothetical protein [Syntrophorhabdus sp.]HPW35558.1 hypothetical protein [Syntrophorhabdus sp.]
MSENRIKVVKEIGRKANGKSKLLKHLRGENLTIWEAVKAHCYDCTRYYTNPEPWDCKNLECTLYPFHLYNKEYMKKARGLD